MYNEDEIRRLRNKTTEQKFLQILQQDYQCAPRIAEAIMEEARTCLGSSTGEMRPGQMRKILVKRKARHGQELSNVAKVEVNWTIDAGVEDLEVLEKHGSRALRQVRIQRLLEEAVRQGGVATQEDLAQVLGSSVRTIKRDFEELRNQGMVLPSRGYLQGIGRGQTHKALIIRRWLNGETYDQLAMSTHHSITSIQRYVSTFVRVVQLKQRGLDETEIGLTLQIGTELVKDYLAVYAQNDQPGQRKRLESHLERFERAISEEKGAQ
jgi:hypothetical protein